MFSIKYLSSDKGGKRKSSEQRGSGGKRADIKMDPKDDAVDEEMPLAAQTSFLGSESCSSSDLDSSAFLTTSRSANSISATNFARPKSSHFVLGSTLPIPSTSTSLQKWPTKTDRLASSSNTSMTAVPSFSRSLHGLDNVIDLTLEESSLESEDIKPDVNKLNLGIERANKDKVKGSSQKIADFVTHAKVAFARDKNVKVEVQESTSNQKYELMHQRFKALQKNVHELLGVLVEDGIDIGKEEDIEDTVVEMIRVTCPPVKKA